MSASSAKRISYVFLGLSFFVIFVTFIQLIGNVFNIAASWEFDNASARYISMYLAYVPFLLLVGVVTVLAITIISDNIHLERLAMLLFAAMLLHRGIVLYVSNYFLVYNEIMNPDSYYFDLIIVTSQRVAMTDLLVFRVVVMNVKSYLMSISSMEFIPIISIAIGRSLSKTNKKGYIISTGASLVIGVLLLIYFSLMNGFYFGEVYVSPIILELALVSYAFYYTYVKDNLEEKEIKTKENYLL